MSLQQMLHKFIAEYESKYESAKNNNYDSEFASFVRNDIATEIKNVLDDDNYKVKGSVGAGKMMLVPWIAIMDKRITESPQTGVYLVYLLNKEQKTLYLTLNQGATAVSQHEGQRLTFTGVAAANNARVINALKENANEIRREITAPEGALSEEINTGSQSYDAGCVFYKSYTLSTLPTDDVLVDDLLGFVDSYKKYYEKENCKPVVPVAPNTVKDNIESIKKYIESRGFHYEDSLVENFYLSLKAKPFVILAGLSGTGKTRLVRLFAQAVHAECKIIPVRPDWSDGSDLFGHKNLQGDFIKGPICECFEHAESNPDKPIFVCLDEMNLARVEYYFSDFLSVLETREKDGSGTITSDAIDNYANGIPENMYIIGTVNMDETTFPFSKKVLDRANTIEFSYVDLMPGFVSEALKPETIDPGNGFLKAEYLILAKDCGREEEYVKSVCEKLKSFNDILATANSQIGYRVRDEIVFYMLNNKEADFLLKDSDAFDLEIMQKILPRIQGSSENIGHMLKSLFGFCFDSSPEIDENAKDTGIQMQSLSYSAKYPRSARKIGFMMTRYEEDGFTSYWL